LRFRRRGAPHRFESRAGDGRKDHTLEIRARNRLSFAAPTCTSRPGKAGSPTFVKLGQILATRVDLFPEEWIAEFELLQDSAPPIEFEELCAQLEEDLGDAPEEVFAEFDRQPLAAASVAQVHRARLMDGTPVVVIIRRRGIKRVVESDLRLMERLAQILTRDNPGTHRFRPKEVVHQFTLSPRRELDLAHECRNATRIASKLTKGDHIVVPKVY
jgi:ubiquinone biosynthesis protein